MCRQAVGEGVHTLVAAHRWEAESEEPPSGFDERENRLVRLQQEMASALTLKQGCVLRFDAGLPALAERYGSSITLGGGRFVLVALPALKIPVEAEEVWGQLALQGLAPMLAGPEGSPALRRDAERLERWLDKGMCLQLNAASITGAHGREARRFALHCARKYPAHVVVASNAREAGGRRPSLGRAREIVAARCGKARAQALFCDNPAEILKSAPTDAAAAAETRKPRGPSSLLQQLFKLKKAVTDAV